MLFILTQESKSVSKIILSVDLPECLLSLATLCVKYCVCASARTESSLQDINVIYQRSWWRARSLPILAIWICLISLDGKSNRKAVHGINYWQQICFLTGLAYIYTWLGEVLHGNDNLKDCSLLNYFRASMTFNPQCQYTNANLT